MSTPTTGIGAITLGSAVSGYLSFESAGVSNGETVSYGIKDGSNSEVGTGVYTSSGTMLTRNVLKSTNGDSPINLSGSAEVYIAFLHKDVMRYGFLANKNAIDQTGIDDITFTKISFTNEIHDYGDYYDSANSRWTPPSGLVGISFQLYCNGLVSGQSLIAMLYKNGIRYLDALSYPSTTNGSASRTIYDCANGSDYYEIYVYLRTASTGTVSGLTTLTNFSGVWLGNA